MTEIPSNLSVKEFSKWIENPKKQFFIIDVREENELLLAQLSEPFMHLPLSEYSLWSESIFNKLPTDKSIVVICHSGIRSWNFCVWLHSKKLGYEVWNLEGGIDAWSIEVDSRVPRY